MNSIVLRGLPHVEFPLSTTPWIKEISVKLDCLKALYIRHMHVSDQDLDLLAKTRDNGVEDDNELVGKANGEWLRELALCNTSIESLHLSLGGKIETMKVGTSNHEKRFAVNRNRETRIVTVPVPVPGFGMVSLGKVDDSMIVVVTNSCSVMGFEAQTCLHVSADCSGWGFLVDVCLVGECFVETCF
ncbi:coronatine-insensitive protein 1-like protein [Tanacetum coccineum]